MNERVKNDEKSLTISTASKKKLTFSCLSCRKTFCTLMSFKRHTSKTKRPNGCTNKDNLRWSLCQENADKQVKYYKLPKNKKKHGICMYKAALTDVDILQSKKNCSVSIKDIIVGLSGSGIGSLSKENHTILKLCLKKYDKLGYKLAAVEHNEKYKYSFQGGEISGIREQRFYYLIKDDIIFAFWRNHDGKMIKVGQKTQIAQHQREIDRGFEVDENKYFYTIKQIYTGASDNKEGVNRVKCFYGRDAIYYNTLYKSWDPPHHEKRIMLNELNK